MRCVSGCSPGTHQGSGPLGLWLGGSQPSLGWRPLLPAAARLKASQLLSVPLLTHLQHGAHGAGWLFTMWACA